MTEDATVEAAGETVGEAKWAALRELEQRHPGLDQSAVQFEVVSEGERGLLGVGYEPARVVAHAPVAALDVLSADQSDAAADARGLAQRIMDAVGVEGRADVREAEDAVTITESGAGIRVSSLSGVISAPRWGDARPPSVVRGYARSLVHGESGPSVYKWLKSAGAGLGK